MARARTKRPADPAPATGGRRAAPFLPLLLLATLGAKAIVLAQLHEHPLLRPEGALDPAQYVALARRVAAGDLALAPEPYFVSPLYVYFLGLALAVSGGSLLFAKSLQILSGTLAVASVHATTARFAGRRAAHVAAILAAATGLFTFSEVLLLQSALDPFLTALALALFARALDGGGARAFVLSGGALGLLALNRPNALAVAGLMIVLVALARRARGGLTQAAAMALGLALAVAPAFARNLAVSGEAILIASHGGLNFYVGNNPQADGTYRRVPGVTPTIEGQARDATRVASRAAGRPLGARETSAWFYARAWEWMRAERVAAVRLFGRKLAYVFNSTDLALNYSFNYYARDEPGLLRVLAVGPWLLLPAGLLGLLLRARESSRGDFLVWAAFVPGYALSVAAFFVSSRYRLPLLLPLCAGAGIAVDRLWNALRERRARDLAAAGVVLAVLGLATNRDFGLDDGRSEERTAMIVHLVDAGRLDEARGLLARTEPTHRRRDLLLHRVGRAFQERGDAREAAELLQRALHAGASAPELRLALGQALLDAGQARQAAPHLRAARDAGVQPAVAGFDLARALLATGDRDAARDALRAIGPAPASDAASLYALGDLALQLDEPGLAEGYLRRGLEGTSGAGTQLASIHERLGIALAMQGRTAEALAELESACRIDPASASAHLNLGVVLAQAGRRAEALTAVERALALKPDYPQALGLQAELTKRARR